MNFTWMRPSCTASTALVISRSLRAAVSGSSKAGQGGAAQDQTPPKRGFDLPKHEPQQVALRTWLCSFQFRFNARLLFVQPLIGRRFGSTPHGAFLSGGTYERPADAFLSGSMSDCAEKGFVRNAMHPESNATLRTAGSSFPVI